MPTDKTLLSKQIVNSICWQSYRNLTVVIPIKPLGNLAVILMQQNEQNGQKYKGFANR